MIDHQILEPHEIAPPMCAGKIDPGSCTALIAAAGRGSRIKSDQPKILYPIAGVSVMQRLVDLLSPFCARFVFVVSPVGCAAITTAAERICPGRYEIAEQAVPTGMLDAVACGVPLIRTPRCLVVWGDQAALRPESVRTCLALHCGPLTPEATLPTLICNRPYIHLQRNAAGTITQVLQAREGDEMPAQGESDCGIFVFRTEVLEKAIQGDGSGLGRLTGERNFLPILPAVSKHGNVLSVRIAKPIEALGVNTREDADTLSRHIFSSMEATA